MIPRIAENVNEGLEAIRSQSLRYMHFFFPMAIVLILTGQWLFTLFFTAQFTESGRIFVALMLLTIPRLLFPQSILMGLKQNKLILITAVIEMLINIVASILLAQRFGMVGVAYGTVVAFVSERMLMMAILYCKFDISPSRYISFPPFLIYTALTVLSYLVSLRF